MKPGSHDAPRRSYAPSAEVRGCFLRDLRCIPGVGEATALALLIEMPEFGTIEHKCVASLAGRAPIARDSGQRSGKRFIRGGRAPLRQALYMPALVAVRFNAAMQVKYDGPPRRRKTAQGGAHRHHAKADHPRQRPAPRRQDLDTKTRLTNTDTLASSAPRRGDDRVTGSQ
jgi:hypothetical protein